MLAARRHGPGPTPLATMRSKHSAALMARVLGVEPNSLVLWVEPRRRQEEREAAVAALDLLGRETVHAG